MRGTKAQSPLPRLTNSSVPTHAQEPDSMPNFSVRSTVSPELTLYHTLDPSAQPEHTGDQGPRVSQRRSHRDKCQSGVGWSQGQGPQPQGWVWSGFVATTSGRGTKAIASPHVLVFSGRHEHSMPNFSVNLSGVGQSQGLRPQPQGVWGGARAWGPYLSRTWSPPSGGGIKAQRPLPRLANSSVPTLAQEPDSMPNFSVKSTISPGLTLYHTPWIRPAQNPSTQVTLDL